MKIAIICYSGAWGGLEINIVKLSGWLKERGNEVILIVKPSSTLAEHARNNNIETVDIAIGKGKHLKFSAAILLAKILKSKKCHNLVIGHYEQYYMAVWAKVFAIGFSIKLLYLQQMQMNVKKKDFYHAFFFSMIDIWLTPLQSLKNQLLTNTSLREDQIHIHPLCCNVDVFVNNSTSRSEARQRFNLDQNIFLIGIAGRLDKEKGQESLIKAIQLLREKQLPISAFIVGNETAEKTGYKDYLIKLSSELNVFPFIIFQDFSNDITTFFKAIDIFAICSVNEPFGMVTVEALLSNVPVVGAATGGTIDILENGELGILYSQKDVNALASAIEKMYIDEKFREGIAKKAQAIAVKKYSHISWCEKIENLLA